MCKCYGIRCGYCSGFIWERADFLHSVWNVLALRQKDVDNTLMFQLLLSSAAQSQGRFSSSASYTGSERIGGGGTGRWERTEPGQLSKLAEGIFHTTEHYVS